jgi:hypothetical protein
VLRLLVGSPGLGRSEKSEKLTWEIPFLFQGRSCSLSLEKFGLRLYVEAPDDNTSTAEAVANQVVTKLATATRCFERHALRPVAESQVERGRLSIRNQAEHLRSMYRYSRRLAEEAYAGEGRLAAEMDAGGPVSLLHDWLHDLQRPWARDLEGLYGAVAMTNSYFSLLEHRRDAGRGRGGRGCGGVRWRGRAGRTGCPR